VLAFLPLREFFSLDVRSLALLRICLALLLLADWTDRLYDLRAHYSDEGIVPRQVVPSPVPISVHFFSGAAWYQGVLAGVAIAFALALLAGYRTPFVTLVSWFLLISIHARNPAVMQGGDHVLRMLLFWSIFLPLGACCSVDAAEPGRRAPDNRVLTPASAALILQVALIYWFAATWKWAPEWRTEGSAVHYALSVGHFSTPLGRFLLGYPEVCRYLTYSTVYLETFGPVLLFVPFAPALLRVLVIAAFVLFHAGLAVSLELSNFPWACMAAWLALLPSAFWDRLALQLRTPERTGLTVFYDAVSARARRRASWLRAFLLLGEAQLVPVGDQGPLLNRLRAHSGWAVRDHLGKEHFGRSALGLLLRLSPLAEPVALFRRRSAARGVRSEKRPQVPSAPSPSTTPQSALRNPQSAMDWAPPGGLLAGTIVLFCLVYIVLYNIRTFRVGPARGDLGLDGRAVPIPRHLARQYGLTQATGVEVVAVEPNGPADKAGLQKDDIIISLGEQPIAAVEDLGERLRRLPIGAPAGIVLLRGEGRLERVVMPSDQALRATRAVLPDQMGPFASVLGLDQGWGLFAPAPGKLVGWFVAVGFCKDGRQVDLMRGGEEVRWDKPEWISHMYPNGRWRKLLMNLPDQGTYGYVLPGYARYLFREWNRAHTGGAALTAVEIHWMREITAGPGQEQQPPVRGTFRYAPGP
jgi:hypothetical protein